MPTELKLLHGERRPSRLNRDAPKPWNLPVMPAGMSEPAQAIWNRITRDYAHTGVLTSVDTDALRVYCEAVVRYERAAAMLEQSGPLVRGAERRGGELVKNPLHQVVRDDADLIRAFARELGFTPSAGWQARADERGPLPSPGRPGSGGDASSAPTCQPPADRAFMDH